MQAVQWTLLEEQERVLAPLAAAFRAMDPGSTGILSPTQCQRFCRLLHPSISPEDADLLLETLDCGTGQVLLATMLESPWHLVVLFVNGMTRHWKHHTMLTVDGRGTCCTQNTHCGLALHVPLKSSTSSM